MEQIKLDLAEPLTADFKFRVQPSLLAIFRDRCRNASTGPVDAGDMLRRLMAQFVQETRQAGLSGVSPAPGDVFALLGPARPTRKGTGTARAGSRPRPEAE